MLHNIIYSTYDPYMQPELYRREIGQHYGDDIVNNIIKYLIK